MSGPPSQTSLHRLQIPIVQLTTRPHPRDNLAPRSFPIYMPGFSCLPRLSTRTQQTNNPFLTHRRASQSLDLLSSFSSTSHIRTFFSTPLLPHPLNNTDNSHNHDNELTRFRRCRQQQHRKIPAAHSHKVSCCNTSFTNFASVDKLEHLAGLGEAALDILLASPGCWQQTLVMGADFSSRIWYLIPFQASFVRQ